MNKKEKKWFQQIIEHKKVSGNRDYALEQFMRDLK